MVFAIWKMERIERAEIEILMLAPWEPSLSEEMHEHLEQIKLAERDKPQYVNHKRIDRRASMAYGHYQN